MKSRLIVLEGTDGTGKSTQLELLRDKLAPDYPIRTLKYPDYEDDSSALVRMYLGGEFGTRPEDTSAYAGSIFYAADRFASYRRHWKDDYEKGTVLLADRYTTANILHQMPKLPREEWEGFIEWLYDLEYVKMGIPRPDKVILLDLDTEIARRQFLSRYQGDAGKEDIHERNQAYLETCREAARMAAAALNWDVVECGGPEGLRTREEIARDVYACAVSILD